MSASITDSRGKRKGFFPCFASDKLTNFEKIPKHNARMLPIEREMLIACAFNGFICFDFLRVSTLRLEVRMIKPGIEHCRVNLNMVLQAIGVAVTKCLIFRIVIGCQQRRPSRKIKNVLMPVKNFLIAWQPCIKPVLFPIFSKCDIVKAELLHGMLSYCSLLQDFRQQLTAQANSQVRNILCNYFTNHNLLLDEVRVFMFLIHMLRAAKGNNGIKCARIGNRLRFNMDQIICYGVLTQYLSHKAGRIFPHMLQYKHLFHMTISLSSWLTNHCNMGGLPLQTISTPQDCSASSTRGQMSVKQLPWWVRSKPASDPVTVSIEKCQRVASLLKTNPISCCIQVLPIWNSRTCAISPVVSKQPVSRFSPEIM